MQTMEKEYICWLFIDRELFYMCVCVYNILYVLMFPVSRVLAIGIVGEWCCISHSLRYKKQEKTLNKRVREMVTLAGTLLQIY